MGAVSERRVQFELSLSEELWGCRVPEARAGLQATLVDVHINKLCSPLSSRPRRRTTNNDVLSFKARRTWSLTGIEGPGLRCMQYHYAVPRTIVNDGVFVTDPYVAQRITGGRHGSS